MFWEYLHPAGKFELKKGLLENIISLFTCCGFFPTGLISLERLLMLCNLLNIPGPTSFFLFSFSSSGLGGPGDGILVNMLAGRHQEQAAGLLSKQPRENFPVSNKGRSKHSGVAASGTAGERHMEF